MFRPSDDTKKQLRETSLAMGILSIFLYVLISVPSIVLILTLYHADDSILSKMYYPYLVVYIFCSFKVLHYSYLTFELKKDKYYYLD